MPNFETSFRLFWREFEENVKSILELESASQNDSIGDSLNQKDADSRSDRELITIAKSIEELSSFVVKIPSIETTMNDFFSQFQSFQARLTPPLRETGLLSTSQVTSPSGNEERNRYRTSLNRLRNIVELIEKQGLLDDNTLQELKSGLKDLG